MYPLPTKNIKEHPYKLAYYSPLKEYWNRIFQIEYSFAVLFYSNNMYSVHILFVIVSTLITDKF